jgi:hypothetical protein
MRLLPTANDARRVFLLALLALVAAFWLVHRQAIGQSETPPTPPAALPAPAELAGAPAPPGVVPGPTDIFSVRTWAPPAPPAPVVQAATSAPPKPEAPPLPFRFLGKIAEPDKGVAFLLARGERVLSVGVGETINGIYLVEKHQDGRLYFIYKPLKIRQSLSVGRDS